MNQREASIHRRREQLAQHTTRRCLNDFTRRDRVVYHVPPPVRFEDAERRRRRGGKAADL